VDFTTEEKFAIYSRYNLPITESTLLTFENLIFLMGRQYLMVNITHYQGLLAARILKAPIKIDILQSNLATIDGVRNALISLGLEQDELKDILKIMLLNLTLSYSSGFVKLWSSYGLFRLHKF
jgi:hypothetical protein